MTPKEKLIELRACGSAIEWASDKSWQEIVNTCHRGDWLLWLAKRVGAPKIKMVEVALHSAQLVQHLMKDERSIKALEVTRNWLDGNATFEQLKEAKNAAADAAADAYAADSDAAAYAAADAAAAAYAADSAADAYAADSDAAAYAAADAAAAAYAADSDAAAYAADAAAAAYAADSDARKNIMRQTADIFREVLGKEMIELLTQSTMNQITIFSPVDARSNALRVRVFRLLQEGVKPNEITLHHHFVALPEEHELINNAFRKMVNKLAVGLFEEEKTNP